MHPPNKHQNATQNIFMESIIGLSTILAVACSFFATPLFYSYTIPKVQAFTTQHYGSGFEDAVAIAWWLISALAIFFGARASLSTGLIMFGMTIVARFA